MNSRQYTHPTLEEISLEQIFSALSDPVHYPRRKHTQIDPQLPHTKITGVRTYLDTQSRKNLPNLTSGRNQREVSGIIGRDNSKCLKTVALPIGERGLRARRIRHRRFIV